MYGYKINPDEVSLNDLDLNHIEFEWVKKTKKIKHLKKALKLIENDGNYYIELKNEVIERLKELDPKLKNLYENKDLDEDTKQKIINDLNNWHDGLTQNEGNKNKIFEADNNLLNKLEISKSENEKNKGNEALKSGDFKEAINYYKNSITFNKNNYISYANMSLSFIKLKNYREAILMANKAIEIDPNYLKSYFRRAKANEALKNFKSAYVDYSNILLKDSSNQEVKDELEKIKKQLNKEELEYIKKKFDILPNIKEESENSDSDDGYINVQINEDDDDENKPTENVKNNKIEESNKTNSMNKNDEEFENLKLKANNLIKKSFYEKALEELSNIEKLFFKKKYNNYHYLAKIYNNMSICYKQLQMDKLVIEYSKKCIDLISNNNLQDNNLFLINYLRMGYSYERLENDKESYFCYFRVKKLMPSNLSASNALRRLFLQDKKQYEEMHNLFKKENFINPIKINKNKDNTTQNETKIPEKEELKEETKNPIKEEIKNPIKEETKNPIKEETKNPIKEETKNPIKEETRIKIELSSSLVDSINKKKTESISYYKNKNFRDFIENTQNALYKIHSLETNYNNLIFINENDKDLFIKLLSNRAMGYLELKKYPKCINDCETVLIYNSDNLKCKYRLAKAKYYHLLDIKQGSKSNNNINLLKEINDRLITMNKSALNNIDDVLTQDKQNIQSLDLKKILESNLNELTIESQEILKKIEISKKALKPSTLPNNSNKPEKLEINKNFDKIFETAKNDIINSKEFPKNKSKFEIELNSFKKDFSKITLYLKKFDKGFISSIYKVYSIEFNILEIFLNILKINIGDLSFIEFLISELLNIKSIKMSIKMMSKKEKEQFKGVLNSINNFNGKDDFLKYFN